MTTIHTLGFPRVGAQRELKFALEKHWRGELSAAELETVGKTLRARHWSQQRLAGLDFISVGDFAYYDHMLNHIQLLGCEPARYAFDDTTPELTRYFTMARGLSGDTPECACAHGANTVGQPALEMTKWFDTNYHYLVPEFTSNTRFHLGSTRLFDEVDEARALQHQIKVNLIGPLSFLWLGKTKSSELDRLALLESLLPVYRDILARLKAQGVEWVQIDEPILALDLPQAWLSAFSGAYWQLNSAGVKLLLATYFGSIEDKLSTVANLPVAGLHLDLVRAPQQLNAVLDRLPTYKILSLGVIDGRNIWRTDLDPLLSLLMELKQRLGQRLWLAPSCSLLHVPVDLQVETALDPEIKSWLAFALQKLEELLCLKRALEDDADSVAQELNASRKASAIRKASARVHDARTAQRLAVLARNADQRKSSFIERQAQQRARFQLPAFPTTTIGSFPQTAQIRAARAAFKRGAIGAAEYRQAMQREIEHAVQVQEEIGLDVLVHGEAERNDMVEYFGEQLSGFAFTQHGWVQSYGSRCVKPPIIYGDVSRPAPMTVAWTVYAQQRTTKPMKGMLTGPVTMLQWSFVRDDQPRSQTCLQIALAIRDEVQDLERAGIGIIQIDEPALREGLPLRKAEWQTYLDWAGRAFRVAASGVADATQIHTHMCYAEFNDILPAIAALDADVITIETARSDMELLKGFGDFRYPNEIGPGVYDIHSPQIPSIADMRRLLQKAAAVIPSQNLWVNPDCGLKTRAWTETAIALMHLVDAAKSARADHG